MTDREMIDQWLVVIFDHDEVSRFTGEPETDADCAVGFVYVDSMCGITLNVDALCKTEGGGLRCISRPGDKKQRLMLRYDCLAGKRMRLLTPAEQAALGLFGTPYWLEHYYEGEESTQALRAITRLDPVRAPGFPDDIKCLLYDSTGAKDTECVWAKLLRQLDNDLLVCRILNEPFQDFGLHEGDLVKVAATEAEGDLVCICVGKATQNER